MTQSNCFIALAFIILSVSCYNRPASLNPEKFVRWVENSDNGFIKQKEFESLSFGVFYKPAAYIAYREQLGEDQYNLDEINKRIDGLNKQYNFGFKIRSLKNQHILDQDNESQVEYFEKLRYYLTTAQGDFKLILLESADTLDCSLYHFERNYGSAPFIDISLAFQNPNGTELEDFIIKYEDHVFVNGTIKFAYEKEDLQNLPQVK